MEKGIIKKLENQKNFLYFQIKPDEKVAYILDEIFFSITKYKEDGLFYPNKDINYGKFVPQRITFHDGHGTIFGIVIFNKDLIDLFLFKGSPQFDKFIKLMRNHFVYTDGTSF